MGVEHNVIYLSYVVRGIGTSIGIGLGLFFGVTPIVVSCLGWGSFVGFCIVLESYFGFCMVRCVMLMVIVFSYFMALFL